MRIFLTYSYRQAMNKTVYIIIPIYNTELYLRRCLDSVFNQTYDNIRVICVNDGSTDGSAFILKEYSSHQNLTVIYKDNGGLSSARNAGLDYLQSYVCNDDGYIAFLDSDDFISVDYVDTLVKLAEMNNCDIVASSFLFSSSESEYRYTYNNEVEGVFSNIEATRLLIEDKTIQSHAHTKIYKSSLFNDIRYPNDIRYMEDQCTTFKLFIKANNVFISKYAGYHYWQSNSNSLTKSSYTFQKGLWAIRAYYLVYTFPFTYYMNHKEAKELKRNSGYALASAFLSVIDKIYFLDVNVEQKKELNDYIKIIKCDSLILSLNASSSKEKIKKWCYLFFGIHIYCQLFNVYSNKHKQMVVMQKDSSIRILVPTHNKNDIEISNILSNFKNPLDVFISNQTFISDLSKVIQANNVNTVGVSKNRNNLLDNATGDINIMIDDDCSLVDNYKELIIKFYNEHPDAEFVSFNGLYTCYNNRHVNDHRTCRIKRFNQISYAGAPGLTWRKSAPEKYGLRFNEKLGTPNYIFCGEDSCFLFDIVKSKAKFYRCKDILFHINEDGENSSYYKGIDERYVVSRGYNMKMYHPYLYILYAIRHVYKLHKRDKSNSYKTLFLWMNKGFKMYKEDNNGK